MPTCIFATHLTSTQESYSKTPTVEPGESCVTIHGTLSQSVGDAASSLMLESRAHGRDHQSVVHCVIEGNMCGSSLSLTRMRARIPLATSQNRPQLRTHYPWPWVPLVSRNVGCCTTRIGLFGRTLGGARAAAYHGFISAAYATHEKTHVRHYSMHIASADRVAFQGAHHQHLSVTAHQQSS